MPWQKSGKKNDANPFQHCYLDQTCTPRFNCKRLTQLLCLVYRMCEMTLWNYQEYENTNNVGNQLLILFELIGNFFAYENISRVKPKLWDL